MAREDVPDGDRRDRPDPVGHVVRWERSGGHWRVLERRDGAITLSLVTCDGGEEMDRIRSTDPALADYLSGRSSSED